MKNNYKIVAVTPAGRQRYLEILYRYLCKNKHILDRWDVWVNTNNPFDLEYIKKLSESDSFINPIYSEFPYNYWGHPNLNISPFWTQATDEDTIYVRFDDDVVFIEKNTIETLVDFRIKNPQYLFVYPFIINNTHHSLNLQNRGLATIEYGKIKEEKDLLGQGIYDPVGLCSVEFARSLHSTFFKHFENNSLSELMTSSPIVWQYGSQISINCLCWFGSLMKTITPLQEGRWPVDEENYLTTQAPQNMNMPLCTAPNTLVSHFLFSHQRSQGEMEDILNEYSKISNV